MRQQIRFRGNADGRHPIRFIHAKPRIKRLGRAEFLGRLVYLDH